MERNIQFEKRIKLRTIHGINYQIYDIFLKSNNHYFDPISVTGRAKRIQKDIHRKYWNAISRLYLDGGAMVVKLSGLHFNIDDVKKYMFTKESRANMILHYLRLTVDTDGSSVQDSSALIECDRFVFKKLFDEFWFALGFELRFEGIVLSPKQIFGIERWSRRNENKKKYSDLIEMASLILDNLENGFHFRVISNGKYSSIVDGSIGQLIKKKK